MPRPTEGTSRQHLPLSKTGEKNAVETLRSALLVLSVLLAAFLSLVSPASAQTPSSDASLSALALSPGTLSPAFASGTTMYTASVGYTVTRVTATAAKSDDNATVSYLDVSDQTLADADTTAEGHQVDLTAGDTVVKVRVTAQDTITTETYTVTVTRTEQDTSLSPRDSDPVPAHAPVAQYKVTFTGAWTNAVTPDGVPAGAHFSRLVGGIHNANLAFLESGGAASAGVEAMAEEGHVTGLRDEILAAVPDASPWRLGTTNNISPTGSHSLTAALTTEYPRMTLVTMIAPSHDWFVGVAGLPLVDSQGRWLRSHKVNLYPWDAGTEDGTDFSLSPSVSTDPQGTIESLRGTGPFTTEPIATLSILAAGVGGQRRASWPRTPRRAPTSACRWRPPAPTPRWPTRSAAPTRHRSTSSPSTGQLQTRAPSRLRDQVQLRGDRHGHGPRGRHRHRGERRGGQRRRGGLAVGVGSPRASTHAENGRRPGGHLHRVVGRRTATASSWSLSGRRRRPLQHRRPRRRAPVPHRSLSRRTYSRSRPTTNRPPTTTPGQRVQRDRHRLDDGIKHRPWPRASVRHRDRHRRGRGRDAHPVHHTPRARERRWPRP